MLKYPVLISSLPSPDHVSGNPINCPQQRKNSHNITLQGRGGGGGGGGG